MAMNDSDRPQADNGDEPTHDGEPQETSESNGVGEKDEDAPAENEDAPAENEDQLGGEVDASPPQSEDDSSQSEGIRSAPLWILAVYLGGLILVFLGERVLAALGTLSTVTTALGVAAVVVGTVLRYSPRFRVGGERKQIETVLGALSITGLVALVLYFATTEWLAEKLGLYALPQETFDWVTGLLTIAWVSLVIISVVPMIFAETAAYPMRHAARPESRRVRAAALAGASLALAAVYGSLFVYSARGLDWEADFSYFKTSKPSESTEKVVESLEDPVLVRAFFPDVNDVRDEVERYLRQLAATSPKFELQIQDRLAQPKLAQELRVTQDGTIVLSQGDASEQLRIGTEMEKAKAKLRTLDGDFQQRLLKLVRSHRTAYLTVGHGELNDTRDSAKVESREARVLKELLRRQNFAVKNLGLTEGLGREVPEDADVVLVLGPSEPLAPEEIQTLKRYANRGGKLFIALDPDAETATEAVLPDEAPGSATVPNAGEPAVAGSAAPPTGSASVRAASSAEPPEGRENTKPRMTAASDWREQLAGVVGLDFHPEILANETIHMQFRFSPADRARLVTNRFSSHASVSTLSRSSSRGAVVVFDGSGSLDKRPGSPEQVDFTVRSMPDTFRDEDHNFRFNPKKEKKDIYNLAAAVTQTVGGGKGDKPKDAESKEGEKGTPEEMRAFVVADAAALADTAMQRFLGNQMLFVDAMRWMAGEESIMGEISTEEDLPIEHTKQEDLVWFYSTIFGAPGLLLGLGLMLARRRRSQGGKQ